jgi:hypothetical protein
MVGQKGEAFLFGVYPPKRKILSSWRTLRLGG